ncbi:MAG: HAD-IA family hydrolase [Polyangiaceae bacterium]|nr:HAD-IA family hydrolase [Myxococcales bacterium]MCB9587163.1 HAD-IA family hydrolase [Polyangiaceae bacterium]
MILQRPAKHVIFDLDGILLDTEILYTRAIQAVVSEYGKHFDWSIKANMIGRDSREGAAYLVETLQLPFNGTEMLARRRPHLERLFPTVEEKPGASAFAAQLKQRNVRMAVATSAERALTDLKLQRHPWFSLFDHLICGDDQGVEKLKPAPDIFLFAAQKLGVEPVDCVVLEDSPAGVDAALAAGMQVIAMPDPELGPAKFGKATAIVAGYDELSPERLGL